MQSSKDIFPRIQCYKDDFSTKQLKTFMVKSSDGSKFDQVSLSHNKTTPKNTNTFDKWADTRRLMEHLDKIYWYTSQQKKYSCKLTVVSITHKG